MKFTFDDLLNGQDSTPATTTVYDDEGNALELKPEQQLGRTGAGGSVYGIENEPRFCVKLFRPQDLADAAKRKRIVSGLQAMLEMTECKTNPRLAWPLGAVKDRKKNIIGYAMRRMPEGGKPFRSLFGGPAAVTRCFPGWGRRELAAAAKDFAETVAWLETQGVRIADFNPNNFMVGADCKVLFLDCDSFMFYERNGKLHASDMFFPDCAAPEILCNPALAGAERTPEQGWFSTAVLAFQLVMLGQHPYTFEGEALDGTKLGSPAENIIAGKCPLGKAAGCRQAAEWYKLWSWLTGSLKNAFITTFKDGHSDPSARIPPETLAMELGKFIYECGRIPQRNDLCPDAAKPQGGGNGGGAPMNGGYHPAMRPSSTPVWGGGWPIAPGGRQGRPCRMERTGQAQVPYRAFGGNFR